MTESTLTAIRDQKELAAKARSNQLAYFLALAELAIPAVLTAGAAGNVTCKEAARRMLSIPKPK